MRVCVARSALVGCTPRLIVGGLMKDRSAGKGTDVPERRMWRMGRTVVTNVTVGRVQTSVEGSPGACTTESTVRLVPPTVTR
mmetsp:Transcript_8665/g.21349  ORF Transcript_8665/g.21349 Transcript_8665/m.21349 type:complete len:82 (+) Transcript_8665:155-400(+)